MWKRMQGKVGAGLKPPQDNLNSPISPLDLYQPQSWDSRATYAQTSRPLKDLRQESEQSLPNLGHAEIHTAQQGHRRQASSVYSQYPITPGMTPQQNQQYQQPDPTPSARYPPNTQASTAFHEKVRNYEATVEISPPSSPEMSPIHVPQLTGPTTSMSFMPSSPPLRMQVPYTQPPQTVKRQAGESGIPVARGQRNQAMGRKPVGQAPGLRNVSAPIQSSYDPYAQRQGTRKLSENQWETVNSLDSFQEDTRAESRWPGGPETIPTVTNLEDMYGAPFVKQPQQSFTDRVRKIRDGAAGKRTPPLPASERPAWKGQGGRMPIVPAPEDNPYVALLQIPRKSSKRQPSLPSINNSRNGTPTAGTPRSRTPMTGTSMTESPLSTMTAKPQNYFNQNQPPPRTSSAGPAAAPKYDYSYEDRFNDSTPASPLDTLPSQKNRSVSNLVPGAFPQSGAPTPNLPPSVSTIERNFNTAIAAVKTGSSPPNTVPNMNQHPAYRNHHPNEVSRFSVTTYATSANASPRTSTDSAPPVPDITYSKYRNPSLYSLASNSSKDSILNRKRPVAPKEHTFDKTTLEMERPNLPKDTSLKVLAVREHPVVTADKSKALPKSPAELSQSDKCLALQAQLDDLALQKANIERSITAMTTLVTSQMTGLPPGLDMESRKREMARRDEEKKKVEGIKEELARVKSQEHEVGIKLHRALRKRDESGGYEPSGLWVRRVTG